MLITKIRIKMLFKDRGKRTPHGFLSALNTLVGAIVDQAVHTGLGSISAGEVEGLAHKSECGLMGRYVNQAFSELEKEGSLDKGRLITRAKKLQEQGSLF